MVKDIFQSWISFPLLEKRLLCRTLNLPQVKVPFLNLSAIHYPIKDQLHEVLENTLENSQFILGRELSSFETAYAQYSGTTYCAGISNGMDALIVALKSCGIGHGDEVIVPSNTFIATVLAVMATGAKPVFAEPDIKTYNITATAIESSITPKTKAIIPVHLYGQACRMDQIMDLAQKHSLYVIEDNAQAQGAECSGKKTGTWGHINATSFYPGKNLGALGDAGAVTTDSQEFIRLARIYRNYGSEEKYHHLLPGGNMRMDELQAGFLSIKLKFLDQWIRERCEIAAFYNEALSGIGDLVLPAVDDTCTHVYHLFVIRTQERDKLQSFLSDAGIQTIIHYPIPPHLQPACSSLGFQKGDFPIAEELANTCLSLPLYPGLTLESRHYVVNTVREFFGYQAIPISASN
jgi:dTDP-4-amino-4,6-dideoxygalactose transaminase